MKINYVTLISKRYTPYELTVPITKLIKLYRHPKKYEVTEKMLKKLARNYWNEFVIVLFSSTIKIGSKNISNSILYYTILLGCKK